MSANAGRGWLERGRAFLSRRSEFNRNVAKLSSGSFARAMLAAATMPIATRLYAPEQFGDLQLLLSIVAAFSGVATLKYEVASVLPDEKEEAEGVLALCLWVVALLGLAIALAALLFAPWFLGLFDAERLQPYAALIVLGFLATGVLRTAQFALVSNKQFGVLGRNQVLHVACIQAGYIGLGLVHPGFLALFASQMLGYAVAIGAALRSAPIRLRAFEARRLWALARRYRKFPMVNAPGVFVNSVAYELPVFLLARFFEAELVGYYMLADRLLNQPTTIAGDAVAKVYLREAAEARHRGAPALRALFRNTASRLLLVSLPFAAVVLIAAPWATDLALGDRYREVGVLMQILILGSVVRFVSSPLVTTFSVVDRQEIGVIIMILSALTRLAAMLAFSSSAHAMLGALAAAQAAFAICYVLVIDRVLAREAAGGRGSPGAPALR
jgi:O-antigen/teichoic acid export membrane protein